MTETRKERGQALVEFSLVLPIFLAIILGMVDFGRVFFVYATASNSLRQAARAAELVGTDPNEPQYLDCQSIIEEAENIVFASIQPTVTVEYFRAQLGDGVPDDVDNPADFTCSRTGSNTFDLSDAPALGDLETGDILRIEVTADVNFVTPFLDLLFIGPTAVDGENESAGEFQIQFASQRTILASLEVDDTGTGDSNGNLLPDEWECEYFGNWDPAEEECLEAPDEEINPDDDPDDDNCDNLCEVSNGTRPDVEDTDGDNMLDGDEIKSNYVLPNQVIARQLDPTNPDTDADGIPDGHEARGETRVPSNDPFAPLPTITTSTAERNGVIPISNPNLSDSDNDGLSDREEREVWFTLPSEADTDEDGLTDPEEVRELQLTLTINGVTEDFALRDLNPRHYDTDGDRIADGAEVNGDIKTHPGRPDTDSDGLLDRNEIDGLDINGVQIIIAGSLATSNPTERDTDGDLFDDAEELAGHSVTTYVNPGTVDRQETNVQTLPNRDDTDGDGLSDFEEVNEWNTDPSVDQTDDDTLSSGNNAGDIQDRLEAGFRYPSSPNIGDTDGDGCGDFQEIFEYNTNPVEAEPNCDQESFEDNDLDGDGMNDNWEAEFCPGGDCRPEQDLDNDDLTNLEEHNARTDPQNPNSDRDIGPGDSLLDGEEVNIHNTNPNSPDTDADGLMDDVEIAPQTRTFNINNRSEVRTFTTNPRFSDTDNDGLLDGDEVNVNGYGTDPSDRDTDDDGINDGVEVVGVTLNTNLNGVPVTITVRGADQNGLDPTDNDSDNDGLTDGGELFVSGTDPSDPDTDDDYLEDGYELVGEPHFTNPLLFDTDGDGFNDGFEDGGPDDNLFIRIRYTLQGIGQRTVVLDGLDPNVADTDRDDLADGDTPANRGAGPGRDPDNRFSEVLGLPNAGTLDDNDFNVIYDAISNPQLFDTDGDGAGDKVDDDPLDAGDQQDADPDGDCLITAEELTLGTDPGRADTDEDGLTDGFERYGELPGACLSEADRTDGFELIMRVYTQTEIENGVSEVDGYDDDLETRIVMTDPTMIDTDSDGIPDSREIFPDGLNPRVTDPTIPDTDEDRIRDGDEVFEYGTLPDRADSPGVDVLVDTIDDRHGLLTDVIYVFLDGDPEQALINAGNRGFVIDSDTNKITLAVEPVSTSNNIRPLVESFGGEVITRAGNGTVFAEIPLAAVVDLALNPQIAKIRRSTI